MPSCCTNQTSAHVTQTTGFLANWTSSVDERTDCIAPGPVAALAATLDRDDPPPRPGDPLPPCWHWLYFLPIHRHSNLGEDGHPRRGTFLPPVPLPRRMWAGGRLQFHRPLRIGGTVSRTSRVIDVTKKKGSSGQLVFLLVRHEISDESGLAVTENQDIVYRSAASPGERRIKALAASDHTWLRDVYPDEVLLFRYSALTFNAHRIHYDRRYAIDFEGYRGLVVQAPLTATLLLELLRDNLSAARVTSFSFRAVQPLFDIAGFSVCGRPEDDGRTIRLWAKDREGRLAMDAAATVAY
jgi:3-methylfumaryl-CoA hydratase